MDDDTKQRMKLQKKIREIEKLEAQATPLAPNQIAKVNQKPELLAALAALDGVETTATMRPVMLRCSEWSGNGPFTLTCFAASGDELCTVDADPTDDIGPLRQVISSQIHTPIGQLQLLAPDGEILDDDDIVGSCNPGAVISSSLWTKRLGLTPLSTFKSLDECTKRQSRLLEDGNGHGVGGYVGVGGHYPFEVELYGTAEALKSNTTRTQLTYGTSMTPKTQGFNAVIYLAQALETNTSLLEFSVAAGGFLDTACMFGLSEMLTNNKTLVSLTVGVRDTAGIKMLTGALHVNTTLQRLSLIGHESISKAGIRALQKMLHTKLRNSISLELSFPRCDLTEADAQVLAEGLALTGNLRRLGLGDIQSAGVIHLASALKSNNTLEELSLHPRIQPGPGPGPVFDKASARELGEALKVNKGLRKLHLTSCKFADDDCVLFLFEALSVNKSLELLSLSQALPTTPGVDASLAALLKSGHLTIRELDLRDFMPNTSGPRRSSSFAKVLEALGSSNTLQMVNLQTSNGRLSADDVWHLLSALDANSKLHVKLHGVTVKDTEARESLDKHDRVEV